MKKLMRQAVSYLSDVMLASLYLASAAAWGKANLVFVNEAIRGELEHRGLLTVSPELIIWNFAQFGDQLVRLECWLKSCPEICDLILARLENARHKGDPQLRVPSFGYSWAQHSEQIGATSGEAAR